VAFAPAPAFEEKSMPMIRRFSSLNFGSVTEALKLARLPRVMRGSLVSVVALAVACGGGENGDDTPGSGAASATGGASVGGGSGSGGSGDRAGRSTGGAGASTGGKGGTGAGGASTGGSGNASGVGGTGTGGNGGNGGSGGTGGSSGVGGAGNATSTGGSSGAGMTPGDGGRGGGASGSPGAGRSTGGNAGRAGQGSGGAAGQGTSGSGNAAGTGGGSTGATCDFASGLNVAWVSFANDVPNPDLNAFKTIFKNTHDAGGRVIRWWFHTNGTKTPGYDSSGLAMKLQQSHIDGVKAILGAAHDAGVVIDLSLWSFDMLQSNAGDAHTNNQALLEKDANRQAYIDNYLTPLVNAIKGTPGLYSWEIFNEPEGMGPKGWATYRTTEEAIQKTVNWLAAAIHTADPNALVTNGAQTFDYCSGVSGKTNYYSDSALIAAGGKQNGTLDFYEVHYYTSNGSSNSAFTHPASYWKLDKQLVMGEFAAAATDGVAQNDLYTNLYTNGYDGAWAWSYDADYKWPAMQAGMQNLINAHADVGACP
jgi:hypothetical protein